MTIGLAKKRLNEMQSLGQDSWVACCMYWRVVVEIDMFEIREGCSHDLSSGDMRRSESIRCSQDSSLSMVAVDMCGRTNLVE